MSTTDEKLHEGYREVKTTFKNGTIDTAEEILQWAMKKPCGISKLKILPNSRDMRIRVETAAQFSSVQFDDLM